MTVDELNEAAMSAALALYTARSAGGLVLRLWDGERWYLRMWNGQAVPAELRFQLLELEPFVMVLLEDLHRRGEARLPI